MANQTNNTTQIPLAAECCIMMGNNTSRHMYGHKDYSGP